MALGLPDAALLIVVAVSAVTDVRAGKIYNVITYPAIVAGLIAAAAGLGPPLLASLLGGLVGGGVLYVMFALGWMGGGDVKLMAAVGTLAGLVFVLNALFYAIFFGGVFAALILIWRGHTGHVMRDLASVLARVMGWSREPLRLRPVGGAFPFGVAIAAGTVTAMVLQRLP